jgi:hypothetical protein
MRRSPPSAHATPHGAVEAARHIWAARRGRSDRTLRLHRRSRLTDNCLALYRSAEQDCQSFDIFAERGTPRDDIRAGLRTTHFERRLLIVLMVDAEEVTILRLLYGGRDLETALES